MNSTEIYDELVERLTHTTIACERGLHSACSGEIGEPRRATDTRGSCRCHCHQEGR
jgi:hypothetical protein